MNPPRSPLPPVVVLAGPTASGKSALALDLANRLDGVVINADSMQVYRELRIVTARPSPSEEAHAPHRLYGVLPAAEPCSAARWLALARAAIEEARASGKVPIVTGGTGLYLRGLDQGIADIPEVPAAIRAALATRLEAEGLPALHAHLARVDPLGAGRIRPGDRQRTLRALEVWEATGRPLSAWQADDRPADRASIAWIWLDPPRAELHARAAARFRKMLEEGAVEEVRAFLALKLDPALPATKALGVPELARHLAGDLGLEAAVEQAVTATRQYIKRQSTWFRHQLPPDHLRVEQFSESFDFRILPFIRRFGLTA